MYAECHEAVSSAVVIVVAFHLTLQSSLVIESVFSCMKRPTTWIRVNVPARYVLQKYIIQQFVLGLSSFFSCIFIKHKIVQQPASLCQHGTYTVEMGKDYILNWPFNWTTVLVYMQGSRIELLNKVCGLCEKTFKTFCCFELCLWEIIVHASIAEFNAQMLLLGWWF